MGLGEWDQAAYARGASPSNPPCSCGRPSTHVRLVAATPDRPATPARLSLVAHCGHPADDSTAPSGPGRAPLVRAGPGGPTTGPHHARWPDLATPSLLLALVTAWLPVPVLVVDLAARAEFASRSWSVLSGLEPHESLGLGWQSAIEERTRRSTTGRVVAGVDRACDVVIVGTTDPTPCRTQLLMEPLIGLDGSVLGHVVWFPRLIEPTDQTGARTTEPTPARRQDLAAEFVVRLHDSLVRHEHAATTIATLVVEVATAPMGTVAGPAWEAGIGAALLARIEPLLSGHQQAVAIGHRTIAVLCEEVSSYREVIHLIERVMGLADDPPVVGSASQAIRLSVGVAFPHLPFDPAETLLAHALQAARLAAGQPVSAYEVVIGTGPGSSDARPPLTPVQEHLSAPSASLQPGAPS